MQCHLILSSNDSTNIHVGDSWVKNIYREKLLGIKIDCNIIFCDHIKDSS